MDDDWALATIATVLLAPFLAAGIATALHGSFFIAAFVGGLLFGSFRRANGPEVTYLVDGGGELLNAVTFIVFGAVNLGPALDEITWQLAAYALLSLTLVRMVPVALAISARERGDRRSRSSAGSGRVASRRSSSA